MRFESRNSGGNREKGGSLELRVPRGCIVVRVCLRVDGTPWKQVETLKSAKPADRVFVVSTAEDGRATVKFGDGKRGRRMPTGVVGVSAHYRTEDGSSENEPEKRDQGEFIVYLDVWTREVTSIEDVQLRESALGGTDTPLRGKRIGSLLSDRTGKAKRSPIRR